MIRLPPPSRLPVTHIAGLPIAATSIAALADEMARDCAIAKNIPGTAPRTVFDANGQGLSLYARDPNYRAAMDRADIIHADGGFLVFLSRFKKGETIPERSATTDFIWQAAARAEKDGLSFFLLGGEPGLAHRAAAALKKVHPGLCIAGTHHGFFSPSQVPDLIRQINDAHPDIIWVGLGKPHEQQFCIQHRNDLQAAWLITCGGCFNFVTGDYKRAPLWMQKTGLEWVHRLLTRPRQMLLRYLITTPHSLFLALTR